MNEVKTCTVCTLEKNLSDFYSHGKTSKSVPRLSSRCKACDIKKVGGRSKDYKLKKWFNDYKRELNCTDCSMSFKDEPYLCDFHHTDPTNKELSVSTAVSYRKSIRLAKLEIAKCIPLCPICHRRRHRGAANK